MFFKCNNQLINYLLEAISKIDKTEVQLLLQEASIRKIDLNIHTNKSVTPLHWAILKCHLDKQHDMLEIVEMLYQAQIDLNKPSNDSKKYYPLHTAARRGLPIVVHWLLEHGADPMLMDVSKKTPSHYVQSALKTKISLREEQNLLNMERLEVVNDLLADYNTASQCIIL